MTGAAPASEPLLAWLWLQLLRLGRWLWPIEVQHLWSSTDASLLLRLPPGFRDVSLKVMQITDAHLSEGPLAAWERPHAERMHHAFRGVRSMANGSEVMPVAVFRELLDYSAAADVDLVALSGDVLNFPQASTAAWVARTLNSSLRKKVGTEVDAAIPYLYTAGNHDWFYEGSAASQPALQRLWRQRSLHPLYDHSASWNIGHSSPILHPPALSTMWTCLTAPLWIGTQDGKRSYDFGAVELGGTLFITLDNSRFQVTYEQVAFLRAQLLRWLPTVLVLHVPLSLAESLRPFHGHVLCGDPSWGEDTDNSWRDERRARWPRSGNCRATELLLSTVLAAAAPSGPLVAVLAGHIHHAGATPFGERAFATSAGAFGAVQYIGLAALDGGHRLVEVSSVSGRAPAAVAGAASGAEQDDVDAEAVHQRAAAAASSADLQDALVGRWCARELLRGIVVGATDASSRSRAEAGGPPSQRLLFWSCLGGAPTADSTAAALDAGLVEQGLRSMLRRTSAAVRHGLAALAAALAPLLAGEREVCSAVRALLAAALPEWASPPALRYEPGRALELQPGCSVSASLNEAVGAWRRGDWEALGGGLAALARETAGCRRL